MEVAVLEGRKGPKGRQRPAQTGKASKTFKVEQVDKTTALDPDEARSALSEAWQQIAEGLRDGGIEDRREAIRRAVQAVIKGPLQRVAGQGRAQNRGSRSRACSMTTHVWPIGSRISFVAWRSEVK